MKAQKGGAYALPSISKSNIIVVIQALGTHLTVPHYSNEITVIYV